jgi:hypothetical protein
MAYKIKQSRKVKTDIFKLPKIKSKGEARSLAIDFQGWSSQQNLSYGELASYQNYFVTLGKKFHLTAEFKENGII